MLTLFRHRHVPKHIRCCSQAFVCIMPCMQSLVHSRMLAASSLPVQPACLEFNFLHPPSIAISGTSSISPHSLEVFLRRNLPDEIAETSRSSAKFSTASLRSWRTCFWFTFRIRVWCYSKHSGRGQTETGEGRGVAGGGADGGEWAC